LYDTDFAVKIRRVRDLERGDKLGRILDDYDAGIGNALVGGFLYMRGCMPCFFILTLIHDAEFKTTRKADPERVSPK
jgi:hypothetical protein